MALIPTDPIPRLHVPADPFVGDRVFVYGTLRRGFINNEATIAFRDGARFLSMGTVPGALYSVGWYPALIEGGAGRVTGELWELATPGLMAVLDEYEGVGCDNPPEYTRERRHVQTEAGPVEAWVYIYIDEVEPLQLIPGGDWAAAFNDPAERI
ncbi:gamma-glutamylcyclotransferase [Palleronia sediminis]|uniref:Gamma-glutamylcyclotransferase n=1 Tax=Palleronia sediminis TaxID=2547833 RepID=A0A4R6A623_9RHOB|nr:gamma-glutamylcyclotransferase family protein [Palleronia sediminis]TDL76243.1 gamma-glutamylcyclotransferase [Palleronia sediminis]